MQFKHTGKRCFPQQLLLIMITLCFAGHTLAQVDTPIRLKAETLARIPAPDADQGAAADKHYIYAIDNFVIAKYSKDTQELVERWQGPDSRIIRHINSCYHAKNKLWCANSNYSQTPMGSSIEIFSTHPVRHIKSHSLGLRDEGSLTWFSPTKKGFIAGFAHYGKKGGLPFKDARYSSVIEFDDHWRRTGGWLFPDSVLARMAPYAASGGAINKKDGLLYVTGHDRKEMYVLAKPTMGPTLIHLATIDVELEGQAFSWDTYEDRVVYGVDRRKGELIKLRLPEVEVIGFEQYISRFISR